jgi:S-adenosylmethionine:tRNA ribosyltransferase-isomerase
MKTSDFDYHLPPELIAQHPPENREDARLLVLERETGKIRHRTFPEIVEYFRPGDLLVLNDTRVIPARLLGKRPATGGKAEVLLLSPVDGDGWKALIRPARRARPGTAIEFGAGLKAVVRKRGEGGEVILDFPGIGDILPALEDLGFPPLPPYIKRDLKDYREEVRERDRRRYQTVFARHPGAVAGPTAGFHFTKEILDVLRGEGVEIAFITLSVGYGTFQPVKTERVEDHRIHTEHFLVPKETADLVNRLKDPGGRLFAVGTTVVRALESGCDRNGRLDPTEGSTDIFIYPGYEFKLKYNLLTNFHLPGSTLIMLVSALAGRKLILKTYAEAVKESYRFYSYGDAMLIL